MFKGADSVAELLGWTFCHSLAHNLVKGLNLYVEDGIITYELHRYEDCLIQFILKGLRQ